MYVHIKLTYEDGTTSPTDTMTRWLADWLLANVICSGFYQGERVMKAIIVSMHN